ncbi:MAG: ABC transporter permease [Patescibacteria group bacterium]|nr:ABC transporter permease [Patescibacteria group bacterium]
MVTTLYRIIKYGMKSFFRNGWQSVPTLSVMTLAMFVFLSLMLFNVFTNDVLVSLRDKIDISVYFQQTVSEDDILRVQRSLESLAEVKSVTYVSRDQALAAFRQRHQDDPTITQALDVLGENPLSASLNIKANDPKDFPVIAAYLGGDSLKPMIDQVTYNQNQVVIDRLASIVDTSQRAGIALTVILSIIAILVTLNTIILTIYSTRDEIGVMRLVGAGNKFIRGPYIVQGVLFGVFAAVLAIVIMMPIMYAASPYVRILLPDIDLQGYFYGNMGMLFGYELIFGILLGSVSSVIAVSRYLKL